MSIVLEDKVRFFTKKQHENISSINSIEEAIDNLRFSKKSF
jgi:hypothetical protein